MTATADVVLSSITTGVTVAGALAASARYYIKSVVSSEMKNVIETHLREQHWRSGGGKGKWTHYPYPSYKRGDDDGDDQG